MIQLSCSGAQSLMSPFIDSMATPEESESLQSHVSECKACERQLQSFISMRNLLARIERAAPPEDLVLETRVMLSQVRNKNLLKQLENRAANILKPIAVPAILGVSLTMLFFGVLLGSLASQTAVMASERLDQAPVVGVWGIKAPRSPIPPGKFALHKPVRTTNPTMIRFASETNEKTNLDEPLTIETHVGDDGRVLDYRIISGPQNPEVKQWIRQLLYFAHFSPATSFGKPVHSTIILSFVAVRS